MFKTLKTVKGILVKYGCWKLLPYLWRFFWGFKEKTLIRFKLKPRKIFILESLSSWFSKWNVNFIRPNILFFNQAFDFSPIFLSTKRNEKTCQDFSWSTLNLVSNSFSFNYSLKFRANLPLATACNLIKLSQAGKWSHLPSHEWKQIRPIS